MNKKDFRQFKDEKEIQDMIDDGILTKPDKSKLVPYFDNNETNKNMLKELEQIIIKANPDIRKLIHEDDCQINLCDGDAIICTCVEEKYKIRDITLEDVLVALGEAKYCIDAMGQMWIDYSDDDRKAQWVFNKSLENQSEDLIKFLHEILCK